MTSLKDSPERWARSLPSWSLLSINEKRAALTRGRLLPPGSESGREEMERGKLLRYFPTLFVLLLSPFPFLAPKIDRLLEPFSYTQITINVLLHWYLVQLIASHLYCSLCVGSIDKSCLRQVSRLSDRVICSVYRNSNRRLFVFVWTISKPPNIISGKGMYRLKR